MTRPPHRIPRGWLLVGLLLTVISVGRAAGSPDSLGTGYPAFIRSFAPEEYGAHHQNWDIVQDDRGLIYVANTHGVLEYDGRSWRLISVPNQSPVRSLAVGPEGRVFVGAAGEFGYLAPDDRGRLGYVSLTRHLPDSARDLTQNVWGTHATDGSVYFQMYNRLVRWRDGHFRTWSFRDTLHTSFLLHDTLVVRQENRGLRKLDGDSLRLMRGGRFFADPSVYALMPHGPGGYVAATWNRGLYVYENGHIRRARTSGDRYARERRVYHGTTIGDSLYAIGTLEGGVAILDRGLRLQTVVNQPAGLAHNRVYAVYADRQGGLWAGLYRGISRVQFSRRFRRFDERNGLPGAVQAIARHRGRLHVGTMQGLFRARSQAGNAPTDTTRSFASVADLEQTKIWALQSTPQALLAGGTGGVYALGPDETRQIETDFVFGLERSRRDSGRIFVSSPSGLRTLELRDERWQEGISVPEIDGAVRSIAQDSTGQVWISRRGRGISRLRLTRSGSLAAPPTSFGRSHGLPAEPALVTAYRGAPLVLTRNDTIYRPTRLRASPDSVRFRPAGTVPPELGPGNQGAGWFESAGDTVLWVGGGRDVQKLRPTTRSGTWQPAFRLRLPRDQVLKVFPEARASWLGTSRGLVRVRRRTNAPPPSPPPVFIRTVRAGGDSLIFGGTHGATAGPPRRDQPTSGRPQLPYAESRVRITYASPTLGAPGATEYQYRLTGFQEEWSRWTDESQVTYPYLPDGTYRFEVRARSMTGRVTEPARFAFTIAPPWYRTWWAYLAYALAAAAAVAAVIRYRTAASRRKLEREQALNERLKEANEQLERTNRMKDEFLANLSHEIRTPMASIQGFAELIAEEGSEQNRHFAELIQNSSTRLHHTLSGLLELAQLRAGRIEPEHEPLDVAEEVRSLAELMQPRAEQKGLALSVDVPEDGVMATLDRFCLERIVNNLLSNAVKFTEEGAVHVRVAAEDEEVTIQVRDTGVGIEEEFQDDLFEEFRQESAGLDRSHEGVGLGLALTRRMTEILDGSIAVDSEKGRGSTFTVRLPRSPESAPESNRPPDAESREA